MFIQSYTKIWIENFQALDVALILFTAMYTVVQVKRLLVQKWLSSKYTKQFHIFTLRVESLEKKKNVFADAECKNILFYLPLKCTGLLLYFKRSKNVSWFICQRQSIAFPHVSILFCKLESWMLHCATVCKVNLSIFCHHQLHSSYFVFISYVSCPYFTFVSYVICLYCAFISYGNTAITNLWSLRQSAPWIFFNHQESIC